MCIVDILDIARHPVWLIECETPVPAGFPSPADNSRTGERIDLNTILLPHPDCTYLARVKGHSMDGPPSHIPDGALMAVDCALKPQPGNVVVAAVEGEFTVKRLEKRGQFYWLVPDNPHYDPLQITAPDQAQIWGVVTHVITELINGKLQDHVRSRRL
ncbi:translesion error-prone DNA polymerase V autoproteolytic subunit [Hymenobacter tibetensis]|uniref:Translesion error-prone DNA polymerase V autoproteolytic subunit n=1 Tax=Hymenobacter tibetensis TaxID=497967 RepID=A0ABY4D2F8_9BACT|nr:translesion error-prone DNA polymerase V autoproteolytic subunit [Hymenobacter tibetensis]UOG75404.1 translesion error-prone DNA polymerase V autoproteolytic subunit [Hymenobacter tibetensis]